MHRAAINGRVGAMCALLTAGADAGIKDNKGYGRSLLQVDACEPKGRALADAACRRTVEDFAKEYVKAAAYADAIEQVPAVGRTRRRKRVHVCGVSVSMVCLRMCTVCIVCVCVCVCVCVWV